MPLCPAQLLFIDGPDACAFAHAQFTSDVAALPENRWQWSAWLDAQGRVRHFYALARVGPTRLMLWLPLGNAGAMRDALARYVMRSKLTLETPPSWVLHALPIETPDTELLSQEVRAHAAGFVLRPSGATVRTAWLAPSSETLFDDAALDAWRAQDIEAGLPLVANEVVAEFVPQALDLERVDAIRFDKGCYPGQEIAARLHFRGGNKRRLRRVEVDGPTLSSGEVLIVEDGRSVGRVLYGASTASGQSAALAVIADDVGDACDLSTAAGTRARTSAVRTFIL